MPKQHKLVSATIRFNAEEAAALRTYARGSTLTYSDIIRTAVQDFLTPPIRMGEKRNLMIDYRTTPLRAMVW